MRAGMPLRSLMTSEAYPPAGINFIHGEAVADDG
jgi:hypothetical protein